MPRRWLKRVLPDIDKYRDSAVARLLERELVERDTHGAARSLTPSGSFGAGRVLVVLNVGAQILTFDPAGNLVSAEQFEASRPKWLLTQADNDYLLSIMKPVYEPGKFANWIAPPNKGIEGRPVDFEYVRLND